MIEQRIALMKGSIGPGRKPVAMPPAPVKQAVRPAASGMPGDRTDFAACGERSRLAIAATPRPGEAALPTGAKVGDVTAAAPYPALFGSAPYVRDPGDAQFVDLMRAAIAADPALGQGPLADGVQAGRVDAAGVRALQAHLRERGMDLGASGVDGKYGPKTHAALTAMLAQAPAPAQAQTPAQTPAQSPAGIPAMPPDPGVRGPGEGPTDAANPLAALPPRAVDAPGGRAFLAQTAHLGAAEREEAIVAQVLAGNVPDAMRQMREIEVRGRTPDGRELAGRIQVAPDYLAIGHDGDMVRMPMTPRAAQRIADALGCMLPTPKLVDEIFGQADVRVAPHPLPPGPQMTSNAYYQRHGDAVDAQLAGQPAGALVAGHKKDVVVSARLASTPGRVAIYGWHRPGGAPIQPLSLVHGAGYADYSHGVRLVAGTMTLNGRPMAVRDVLADPALAPLLSNEGVVRQPRYPA